MLKLLSVTGLALAGGVAAVLVTLALTSCASSPRAEYATRPADKGAPALHAVHNERLQAVMSELNHLTHDRLPQEFDIEAERDRRLAEAAEVAGAIAHTAKRIPDVLPRLDLNEEQRDRFVELSDKLEVEAFDLERLARQKSARGMEEGLDRLVAACHACHTAFRLQPVDSPGR